LTLAPALAQSVISAIAARGLQPAVDNSATIDGLPYPGVAETVWDTL